MTSDAGSPSHGPATRDVLPCVRERDWSAIPLWVTVALVVTSVTVAASVAAQPNTRLRGEVTYQDGPPAGNVEVEIVNVDTGNVVDTTTTRSDGTWGNRRYQPGNYTVDVDRPGVKAFSTTVELNQGEAEKIDTVLENVTGDISGTVTDRDGDPAWGLDIVIRNSDTGTIERRVTTRSDGTYGPVQVPANANYTASIDSNEWEGSAPTVDLSAEETETVDIAARRTVGDLTVAVSNGTGATVEGVTVEIVDADTGGVAASGDTASDGTTDAVTLSPGSYTARIADDGWQSTGPTVQLDGGESETISLTGQRTTGSLSGTVTDADGAPIEGATVTVANASTGATVTSASTDSNGEWGPVGVPLGRLTVTASASDYRYGNRTVSVGAGEDVSVPLSLRAAGGVRIESTDASLNEGALTATVTLGNDAGTTREETVTLSVDGSTRAERTVSLSGGETRTVTLEAELADTTGPREVTVGAGEESATTTVVAETDATATPTPTQTVTESATASATPTATSDGDGAGLGPVLAVLALAVTRLALATRTR